MNYIVYITSSKKIGVKNEGSSRAIKTFDNKSEALKYAQELAKKNNGKVIDKTSSLETKINKEIKKTKKKAKNKIKKFIISLVTFLLVSAITYVFYTYFYKDNPTTPKPDAVSGVVYEDLEFHFMQLGNNKNGDAIYIKAGDIDILIDAGVGNTSTISSYMNNYIKDNKLEYVIVTHGDSDHIEGFYGSKKNPGIFYQYDVDTIIDFAYTTKTTNVYDNYIIARENAVSKGAKHYTAKECYNEENGASRIYKLTDNISMEILWNYYYFENTTDNENNYSVITRFKYNDQYFLFTGDLEKDGEKKFVEHYSGNFPSVELYKAAHHGSKTSSNEDFLNLINPRISVVSCSAGNPEYTPKYKNTFPTQDYINRIAKYTDQVYATSLYNENYKNDNIEKPLNGNIIVSSNGTEVAVASTNNLTKLKDSEWFNSTIYINDEEEIVAKDTKNAKAVICRTWPK